MKTMERFFLSCFSAVSLSLFVPSGVLYPQTIVDELWVTNGTVWATAFSGNTIYIGGTFTHVGPSTGGFAAIDMSAGTADASFPRVVGSVNATAPDGSGGWYIGGYFTAVGGVARNNIAHIKYDNTVDATWNPDADDEVDALAVSGSTVYVGGYSRILADRHGTILQRLMPQRERPQPGIRMRTTWLMHLRSPAQQCMSVDISRLSLAVEPQGNILQQLTHQQAQPQPGIRMPTT